VSTLKGKCKSDQERRDINTIHTNRGLDKYGINAAESSQKEELLPGMVSLENGMGKEEEEEAGGFSSGIMALIIICSVSIFIFLVVIGIFKYRQ